MITQSRWTRSTTEVANIHYFDHYFDDDLEEEEEEEEEEEKKFEEMTPFPARVTKKQ